MAIEDAPKQEIISRIAPTPSGYLHIGNAFSFVLTWLLVRSRGGKLLLRIDDSDASRSRPEFIDDIFQTLDWLQLDYDLGPEGPADFARNFSQSRRMDLYQSVLEALRETPGRVYACSCSRKQIQQQSATGLYPGSCREKGLSFSSKKAAWRIHVPEEQLITYTEEMDRSSRQIQLGREMGDFVIRRKDRIPAYQLTSLADDMYFGVNLLVRGNDLQLSTAAQLYLAEKLNLSAEWSKAAAGFQQAAFFHHPLVRNQQGEKLSKSKGASSIAEMRRAGKGPALVYQSVAGFLGIPVNEAVGLSDLLHRFHPSLLRS